MTRRDFAAVAAIALALALFFTSSLAARFDGLGIDGLFWLRQHVLGPPHTPAENPVAVIAIDEETYRRPPFADTPQVLWTPALGKILGAIFDAGATVAGLDVIYSTSLESYVPGYERDFLRALRRAGSEGRLVMGYVQHQTQPIAPYRGYIIAGGADNLRALNLVEDADGIVRRIPLFLDVAGSGGTLASEPSFALELAARAKKAKAGRDDDGTVRLDGAPVRTSGRNALGVNFDTGPGAVPTYSFADLAACADAGNAEYFRQHFAGRVVLVGTVLDVEDRKLTSMRLVTEPEGAGAPPRCVLPPMTGLVRGDLRRDAIPGVYIHAAAIANLMRGTGLVPASWAAGTFAVFALALVVGIAVMRLRLGLAAATGVAMLALWAAAALFAFAHNSVLPVLNGGMASSIGFACTLAYRFGVTDRNRRRLAKAFALYLPGPVVERLMASGAEPALGGELRIVSILFTDLAGFTRASEYLDPQALVGALNTYFAAITAIIESHGGFVDKFIGDAVVGVFGAPLDDPDHAWNAVRAALAILGESTEAARALAGSHGNPPATRVGVNSGPVLIGNIGSPRRFNYTVMGDAVNLASRVEGANKRYGTHALVTDATMAACGGRIVFREIDTVAVKGRARPVAIYEPLGETGKVPDAVLARSRAFAEALRHWRVGAFSSAAAGFRSIAGEEPAAAHLAKLAEEYVADPPADWGGVSILTEK